MNSNFENNQVNRLKNIMLNIRIGLDLSRNVF